MALFFDEPRDPYQRIVYGVAIRLTPGRDAGGTLWRYGYEVQRAPDSGGSPGTPVDIFVTDRPLPGPGGVFVDQLAPASPYFHYRWRHVGPGFGAGAYSAYLKLAADQLSQAVLDVAVNNAGVYPLRRDEPYVDGEYAVKTTDSVGKPLRSQAYTDAKYPALAVTSDGERFRCIVRRSSNLAITTGAGLTTVGWNTEAADVGSLHDNATNNDRITIPTGGDGGFWIFTAHIEWAANATGERRVVIEVTPGDGIEDKSIYAEVAGPAAASGQTSQMVIAIASAPAVGRVFRVRVSQTSGGDLNVIGDTVSERRGSFFQAIHVI